ncbi:MAG: sulfatase-like hydrolase/transferase [Verrucomicrobiales bacterium]|nr:sulfatase-like hydrolase/transferase [Verrucomicrobiales bacterium]
MLFTLLTQKNAVSAVLTLLLIPCLIPAAYGSESSAQKPNILWIVAEDMSPTLGCYGDNYATTPHLNRFATESVLYTHAFAAAPVCSPSRSCLITGMNPVTMGTNQMRSAFPLPTGVHGFPSYLRQAGYYTSNNVKTDYNNSDAKRITQESWDQSSPSAHWRDPQRKKDQAFFAIFNDMSTHQSRTMVWPYPVFQEQIQSTLSATEIHDPANAPVPPYYPDTATVRKTIARYYDCVTAMDHNVGKILAQLEDDGLADDTIVFFYSDHGSGMPRHKRLLLDSGMKVPLMIRFPKKYQHLAPAQAGEKIDRLVSFVDFAPTVLALAAVQVPDYMQGQVFLGPQSQPAPQYIYGARDRVDEVFDCARSLRGKKYLYIRNYLPHLSYNQPSVFSDLSDIRKEFRDTGKMSPAQLAYAGPTRAVEEFYDCDSDPLNLINLAAHPLTPIHQKALTTYRAAFDHERSARRDVGALPESLAWQQVQQNKIPLADLTSQKDNDLHLNEAWAAADLLISADQQQQLELLKSDQAAQRYWAVIGLRHTQLNDPEIQSLISPLLDDPSPPVRIEAASWLATASKQQREAALKVLAQALDTDNWYSALHACRAIELLGGKASPLLPTMKKLYQKTRHAQGDENFFLAFSSGAFLEQLGESTKAWDFAPKKIKK